MSLLYETCYQQPRIIGHRSVFSTKNNSAAPFCIAILQNCFQRQHEQELKRVTAKVMVVQANALNLYLSLVVYVCLLCMVLQVFSFCAMELLIVDCDVSPL